MDNHRQSDTNKIPIETAVVAFVDVLGYQSLVQRLQDNTYIIEWLEKLITDRLLNFRQRLHRELQAESTELLEYRAKIVKAISTKALSDTFLFTLYMDRLDFDAPENTAFDAVTDAIWIYFLLIEMFCSYFIAKTGHVFRGGISIGKHYESNLDSLGNFFIFSTSYLNAVNCEKKAKYSRIIIDNQLREFLNSLDRCDYIQEHFYKDVDDILCLDIYSFLDLEGDDGFDRRIMLRDIKKGLTANIQWNQGNNNVLEKLSYFSDYHNSYLKKHQLEEPELYIEMMR